jgi:septal ring factor EnvC (AmiA/AmiB activator)
MPRLAEPPGIASFFKPAPPGMVAAALCLALAAATPPHSALAQSDRDLRKIEGEIAKDKKRQSDLDERAKSISGEIGALRRQLIKAARDVQEHEAHMSQLEDKLAELNTEADRRRTALLARRQQMQGTLAAMERLARNPPHALLLTPGTPLDVARSAVLLRAAVPHIQTRARALQEEIAGLGQIQADILAQYEQLKAATDALDSERRKLEALLNRKASLRRMTEAEREKVAKRVARLSSKARNLRDLFSRLDKAPPVTTFEPQRESDTDTAAPVAVRRFPKRGGVTLPARGRIISTYGQNTGYGNASKGLTIETRPGAQVVAPFDGRVVFAGPFRGYGKILIIEHKGGYHSLLAGLARVDGVLGQWLLAGEPVGVMAVAPDKKTQLYLELRRRGQAVNPLPWIAEKSGRRRG